MEGNGKYSQGSPLVSAVVIVGHSCNKLDRRHCHSPSLVHAQVHAPDCVSYILKGMWCSSTCSSSSLTPTTSLLHSIIHIIQLGRVCAYDTPPFNALSPVDYSSLLHIIPLIKALECLVPGTSAVPNDWAAHTWSIPRRTPFLTL